MNFENRLTLETTARALVLLALIGLFFSARPVHAAVVEGVTFSDRLSVEGRDLELRGAALLRYKIFLKAYVAALYVEPTARPVVALHELGLRLEIEYFWSIPASGFADATREGIARNVDDATYLALEPRIERLNELYRDVQPGDRYSLTYVPEVGTELSLNGARLGLVEGEDFAAAFFDIWLGEEPLDASLKANLLGVS